MTDNTIKPDSPLDHLGELEMRQRFPSSYQWDEYSLPQIMRPKISAPLARFIQNQSFFFIATANNFGHCDASFRGSEPGAEGAMRPACIVLDESNLIFPDFSGNGLYNSLGNIATNPHIGMLFVDFNRQSRARINGQARVINANPEILDIWPTAQAMIHVTVEQAYGNCPARIPKMTLK